MGDGSEEGLLQKKEEEEKQMEREQEGAWPSSSLDAHHVLCRPVLSMTIHSCQHPHRRDRSLSFHPWQYILYLVSLGFQVHESWHQGCAGVYLLSRLAPWLPSARDWAAARPSLARTADPQRLSGKTCVLIPAIKLVVILFCSKENKYTTLFIKCYSNSKEGERSSFAFCSILLCWLDQ